MKDSLSGTYLPKSWSRLGQVLIIACAILGLVLNILSFTVSRDTLLVPCQASDSSCTGYTIEQAEALASVGISLDTLNRSSVWISVTLNLVFFMIAGLILWRRSDSWIGLLTALWFVLTGPAAYSGDYYALIEQYPALRFPTAFLNAASFASFIPFLFLFPNSRFVPSWTRWFVLAVMPFALLGSSLYGLNKSLSVFGAVISVLAILVGLGSQIIRYRRYATPRERQQTKLVLFSVALLAVLIALLLTGILISSRLSTKTQTLIMLGLLFLLPISLLAVPLTIGFSLLYYRLWDIDLIIRRTLQYSLLTGLLGLVYFGGVALLQTLLSAAGGQPSPVVIVLTTMLIAAMFNPLRRRVQDFIDRRFYRQKYDAEKALAAFSAEARSETDLEQLASHLTGTVRETLQPERVSLWLQRHGGGK